MARTGEAHREGIAAEEPEIAADLLDVVIDPPDRVFDDAATIDVGGRPVELRFLGRGHTDHDAVVSVPGAAVLFAGDLLEADAVPYFGDGFPLDWPATAAALVALVDGVVVPGARRSRPVASSPRIRLDPLRDSRISLDACDSGELDFEDALAETPFNAFPAENIRRPLRRALEQLRGELDPS